MLSFGEDFVFLARYGTQACVYGTNEGDGVHWQKRRLHQWTTMMIFSWHKMCIGTYQIAPELSLFSRFTHFRYLNVRICRSIPVGTATRCFSIGKKHNNKTLSQTLEIIM
jgi:hypothetical protein